MQNHVIQVEERPPLPMFLPLCLQHLFAMFGATILVPFLFKVDPTTCIFLNGVGTLLFIFLTKGKVPAYLGSSFAIISPVLLVLQNSPYSAVQSGFIVFGLVYVAVAFLIKKVGTDWIDIVFPPAAMGAIVAIIGLELAPTAASMAGLTDKTLNFQHIGVALFTLAVTIIASVAFRGFLAIIPILFGVVCGYVAAVCVGMVDFTPVINAPWFRVPTFQAPTFDLNASSKFKIGTFDAILSANVQNLLNTEYITDATDGSNHDWETSPVFYGFGRTFSTSLKIKF